jgi:3-hydroxyacyl-[acyl-carrier-protein] dehydratase
MIVKKFLTASENNLNVLKNISGVALQEYQKNKYPYFFLDIVEEVKPGSYAKGYKNLTHNEWFFPCHFENDPNMPGMLQVEAMLQMFLMTFLTLPNNKGKATSDIAVDDVRFFRKVIPGDVFCINAVLKSYKRGIAIGEAHATVNGEKTCKAKFKVALLDEFNKFLPKIKRIEYE